MKSTDGQPCVRTGHVHLRVTDLERSTAFYREVLGFHVTVDGRTLGLPVVWLTAVDHRHHVALTAFGGSSAATALREDEEPGYLAVHHTTSIALAEAVIRLVDRQYPISHAGDHDGTVSIHLVDPDDNEIELYYDRPRLRRDTDDRVARSEPFDPVDLIAVVARRSRDRPLS